MERMEGLIGQNITEKLAQQSARAKEAKQENASIKRERDFQDAFMKTLMIRADLSCSDAQDLINRYSDEELLELDDAIAKRNAIPPMKRLLHSCFEHFEISALIVAMLLCAALTIANNTVPWSVGVIVLELALALLGVYVLLSLRPLIKNSVRKELRQKYDTVDAYAAFLRGAPQVYVDRLPYWGE